MRILTRVSVALGVVVLLVVAGAAPAGADAAGPTDYRTRVVSVDPPADVDITIIGGDSFLQLSQLNDDQIDVVGYSGEPYLRYLADGTVLENQRSPATFINRSRYGSSADVPADLDADAEPEWVEVASSGTYAWHDHRAHWMNDSPPLGLEPGDQILEAVVPLQVAGQDVDVTVASYWVEPPSPLPAMLGALVGLIGALWLVLRPSGARPAATVGLVAGLAALAAGVSAYWSVPASTGPSVLLWMLPGVAVLASIVASIGTRLAPVVRNGLVLLAGIELLWWSMSRRDAVVRAIIPTDTPMALDRAVIVAVGVISVGLIVAAVRPIARGWNALPDPVTD